MGKKAIVCVSPSSPVASSSAFFAENWFTWGSQMPDMLQLYYLEVEVQTMKDDANWNIWKEMPRQKQRPH